MTEELLAFQAFVASIHPTADEKTIAEQLGRAKALWAEAALSLSCVRQVDRGWQYNVDDWKPTKKEAAKGQELLAALGFVKPTIVERRI